MKLKSLILIAFVAIVTLSFSFASSSHSEIISENKTESAEQSNEPIRGFISEDKF